MAGRDLSGLRESYERSGLRRVDLAADPVDQFARWWDAWLDTAPYDPAACVLATADATGAPSARVLLCRGFDADGFVLYTNQHSRKGQELAANPRAALVFAWLELSRQVRVEGLVSVVDAAAADAYWDSRPRGSRIGAWASDQSEVVADRAELDRRRAEMEARFGTTDDGDPIERPPYWGGYRVSIERIEFWQGQPNRLHDRFVYERADDGWTITRRSP
jgi:pyridoxamine 5'-phosphate oxidase